MKAREPRGPIFSSIKVQEYASAIGIHRRIELEAIYDSQFLGTDIYAVGAPKKAWEGKKVIEYKYAQQIAQIFGLPDYLMLLEDQGKSSWEKIITTESYQDSFIQFLLESEGGSGLFDLPFLDPPTPNKNDQININERFSLKLKGKPGNHFMAILQSEKETAQLAPLSHDGFNNIIGLSEKELRYPSEISLPFSKDSGLGWRRLTVLRSSHLPLVTKSVEAGSPIVSSEYLESFARRLLLNKGHFKVDTYLFNLVNTETIRFKS